MLKRHLIIPPLLAALAACGVVTGDEAPAGLSRYDGDRFRIDYPSGWSVREGESGGRPAVQFNGPSRDDGTRSAEVQVIDWGGWRNSLQDKVVQFRGAAPRSGYEIGDEEPVLVPGARAAHRFHYSNEIRTATGAKIRMRITETFVLTEKQRLLDVVTRSPEGAAGKDRLATILGSFAVEEKDGWFGDR
ncbi:hypothetical protein [Actinomadura sp. 7K507]|uniref:hypothetical protein n=1 Tax=Actinomadura sp. 7K507 TaxID=2530365 RepID=UPI00104E8BEB|nr:hypothetical protein [Actinomadura sp. 7K507]TDC80857.1 hypothetical protein E1285_34030 [Actinomadura sp. 7K507]